MQLEEKSKQELNGLADATRNFIGIFKINSMKLENISPDLLDHNESLLEHLNWRYETIVNEISRRKIVGSKNG